MRLLRGSVSNASKRDEVPPCDYGRPTLCERPRTRTAPTTAIVCLIRVITYAGLVCGF